MPTVDSLLERGWLTLEELLQATAHSPVDPDEAQDAARTAGIDVVERDSDPWEDIHRLAEEGPDAFREPVREGPATEDELAAQDPGTFYLHEISRTPLLTAEEEVELAQAIEAGKEAQARLASAEVSDEERTDLQRFIERGEAARRRMIESNLRLVVSVARKNLGRGLSCTTPRASCKQNWALRRRPRRLVSASAYPRNA